MTMRMSADPSRNVEDYPFSHPIRVRFAETDAMGIVHHAAYLPYLEEARIAYLRALDHPYAAIREEGLDITVLEAAVRYRQPLRFDEVVDVGVRLASGSRTTFQLTYLASVGGAVRATAVTVHGLVDRDGRPCRFPSWLTELLA